MDDSIIDRAALDRLLQTVGGDAAFLAELCVTFFTDTPAQLAAMRQSILSNDADGLRRAAHSLKSNSANFGATNLAQMCKELETIAQSGALDSAAERIAPIEAEYERAKRALQAARSGTS